MQSRVDNFTLVLMFFLATGKTKASKINCEKIDRLDKFEKCCYLNETTIISTIDVTFAGLESPNVRAAIFDSNQNVQFLPVNIYTKFPNLEVYLAKNAAVTEISALNIQKLLNLKLLDLQNNRIEFIPDDCFQGLTKLNRIILSMYKNLLEQHIYQK